MKKFCTTVIVLALAVTAAGKALPVVKPERAGMQANRLALLTDMSKRYVDEGKIAGIVTVVARDGKIVHFEAVGSRGADDSTPLAKDDLFRIYSMTKPIAATAAMQLYEQGKFALTDPVSKFVPELADLKVMGDDGELVTSAKPMTMQQLLTHTTGLSYGFNAGGDLVDKQYAEAELWQSADLDEFAEKVGKLPLKFEPGTRWHYSIAVDITGLVVQRISGQPFDEYLQEHMFAPLGMQDTFFEVPQKDYSRFLPNHGLDPETRELTTFPVSEDQVAMQNYKDVGLFSGGGGLVSTAMDYMRFAEAMRNGGSLDGARILSPKTVRYMATNHLPASVAGGGSGEQPLLVNEALRGFGFGLGFGLTTDPAALGVIGSPGEFYWGGAAGTVFWIDPVEEIVAVGMIQLMGSPWPLRHDMKVAIYQSLADSYETF